MRRGSVDSAVSLPACPDADIPGPPAGDAPEPLAGDAPEPLTDDVPEPLAEDVAGPSPVDTAEPPPPLSSIALRLSANWPSSLELTSPIAPLPNCASGPEIVRSVLTLTFVQPP